MKLFILVITLGFGFPLFAQHSLKIAVKKGGENEPLAGATASIASLNRTVVADSNGVAVFSDIPPGKYGVAVTFSGLAGKELTIIVPQPNDAVLEVFLEEDEEHEEEVIISTTRISRSIDDIPTRVETISGEELTEKSNMKPGDIRMLLNESTGIQTQQTSATSYNSSIRIQGLDGRYTQILRDGLPLFGGFSGSLSIMQVAPLDLKQVEVIKGSSSTLYGGGAIAGLVNLISKTPAEEREISLLANVTSAKGLDLSGFYSQRFSKVGVTLFASRNYGHPYDPADIGLTAIPKFERYTINPRLFYYGKNTDVNVGINFVTEDRTGGNMKYFDGQTNVYNEQNKTDRISSQFILRHQLSDNLSFSAKNSFSNFKRYLHDNAPRYGPAGNTFAGVQNTSFTEATLDLRNAVSEWVFGINYISDDFDETSPTNLRRDYHYNTLGVFLQNTASLSEKFTIETGVRGDYVMDYGFEFLPRLSVMFKPAQGLTMRLGGGMGYKTPTIFNEEAERISYWMVGPIDRRPVHNERSTGGNFDINYRTSFGSIGFMINQLLFYTRVNNPLVMQAVAFPDYQFVNADGFIDTKGTETNLRLSYSDFKLFIGYTYADVNTHFNNTKAWYPLTSKHRLNNVLMFEKDEKLKIGLEAYYFSRQKLNDNTNGKSYWVTGFMVEKIWNRISAYINFENFTDTRQTKFDTIFTGTAENPVFRDIYAPVDGFVVNGGIKIRL